MTSPSSCSCCMQDQKTWLACRCSACESCGQTLRAQGEAQDAAARKDGLLLCFGVGLGRSQHVLRGRDAFEQEWAAGARDAALECWKNLGPSKTRFEHDLLDQSTAIEDFGAPSVLLNHLLRIPFISSPCASAQEQERFSCVAAVRREAAAGKQTLRTVWPTGAVLLWRTAF